jgi:hypothetical protein
MAWLAVCDKGMELIFNIKPMRLIEHKCFVVDVEDSAIKLPKGSIKRLIGRDLTWDDEPVEYADDLLKELEKVV